MEFEFDQKPTISNYIAIQNFVVKSFTRDKTVCLAMSHCASAYWNDLVSSYLRNRNEDEESDDDNKGSEDMAEEYEANVDCKTADEKEIDEIIEEVMQQYPLSIEEE